MDQYSDKLDALGVRRVAIFHEGVSAPPLPHPYAPWLHCQCSSHRTDKERGVTCLIQDWIIAQLMGI